MDFHEIHIQNHGNPQIMSCVVKIPPIALFRIQK